MAQTINQTTVIDPSTGEVLSQKSWIGFDGFSDNGYRYRPKTLGLRFFFEAFPQNLSKDAWLLLLMIAELMNNENVIVYRVQRKSKFSSIIYKPYDKDEIREHTRFQYRY